MNNDTFYYRLYEGADGPTVVTFQWNMQYEERDCDEEKWISEKRYTDKEEALRDLREIKYKQENRFSSVVCARCGTSLTYTFRPAQERMGVEPCLCRITAT